MAGMIPVTGRVAIDPAELRETFTRAPGPGGQHVNTTASAVTLRFDVAGSPSLPEDVRQRLLSRADRRLTADGVLVIVASEHRSQLRNREAALERLVAVIRAACVVPRVRRATRPTLASKTRRLEAKGRRSTVKAGRRTTGDD